MTKEEKEIFLLLEEQCEEMSIPFDNEKEAKLYEFYRLLIEKNKVMNLTSITDLRDVVIKHFVDSLSIAKTGIINIIQKVADVGTGAGFPGVPLAIVYPELEFVLMDSLKKRISFIEEVSNKCGLKNIRAIHGRVEDLGHMDQYREQFDLVVSRAVASLPVLTEYCSPFAKRGGYFISYKSLGAKEEISNSKKAMEVLKMKEINFVEFSLTDGYSRSLIVLKKTGNTPKKYPRKSGTPQKNPLL